VEDLSCKDVPEPFNLDKLYLLPTHSNSVLSMLSSACRQQVINGLFGTEGLSDAKDVVTFDLRSQTVGNVISANTPGFLEYFSSRIERLMKDNLQVSINQRNNGLDCAHWMNNKCESANHQLKMVIDWKVKSLTQLTDALHKEVQSQYTCRACIH